MKRFVVIGIALLIMLMTVSVGCADAIFEGGDTLYDAVFIPQTKYGIWLNGQAQCNGIGEGADWFYVEAKSDGKFYVSVWATNKSVGALNYTVTDKRGNKIVGGGLGVDQIAVKEIAVLAGERIYLKITCYPGTRLNFSFGICFDGYHQVGKVRKVTVEPTCSSEGTAVYACELCDQPAKTETIPKTAHTPGALETDPITGRLVQRCKVCNELIGSTAKSGISTKNPLGKLAWYENGKLVDYTGFETFEGALFYFEHGVVRDDLAGVVHLNNVWYAFDHGRLMQNEMLVPFEGGVFFFKNGMIDTSKSGMIPFNGERFVFAYGMFQPSANGVWMDPLTSKWYYVAGGQFYSITDVLPFDGAYFYFINGELATWFTGDVTGSNGVTYHIVGGQAQ